MPAKDTYHDAVRTALIRDGWTITHDPYTLAFGSRHVFVDLGAERTLAAERGGERIAVEVKSFVGPSDLTDLEMALGQYAFYRSLLTRADPGRALFLAIPADVYEETFTEPIARPPIEDLRVALFTFDPSEGRIIRWMP
jgi:hypothetical protein